MNFVTKDNGFGWMWECPDYFQTDGEQILIFLRWILIKEGNLILTSQSV